jgi:hypothetical protein
MAPQAERTRSSRALWIAAAVALFILLILFAVRAYRAASRAAPDERATVGAAAFGTDVRRVVARTRPA